MTWLLLLTLMVAATVALLLVHGSDHRNDVCPDCHDEGPYDCGTCGRTGTGW